MRKMIIKALPAHYDAEHYADTLYTFPPGRWFTPTNKTDEAYSICQTLHEAGLIDQMREAIHHGSQFRGYKVSFRYNNYSRIS